MSEALHNKPRRPLLRYHGGKWKLAPWIISHFPEHRCYTEVFGGGGSVLLRKERCYAEVYNDLDGEVVNLFRVVRENGGDLCHAIALTPFSRDEFELSYEPIGVGVEQARRTLLRAAAGFGSNALNRKTGFRANTTRSGTTPAADFGGKGEIEEARRLLVRAFMGTSNGAATQSGTGFKANTSRDRAGEWSGMASVVSSYIARMKGVVIENRDATRVLLAHDAPTTLHYVDPPYVAETRDRGGDYRHEMTDVQHEELAEVLHTLTGKVVLSGYPCALYNRLFADWHRVERGAHADGARARTEVLWMNFKPEGAPSLF